MLPPARPAVSSVRSEPERLPNITPRKLFDLLDNTGDPLLFIRPNHSAGLTPNTATSRLDQARSLSPATGVNQTSTGTGDARTVPNGQLIEDMDLDREPKRRRLGAGEVCSVKSEGRSEGEREEPASKSESSPPTDNQSGSGSGMSGMAVLATAAAASR